MCLDRPSLQKRFCKTKHFRHHLNDSFNSAPEDDNAALRGMHKPTNNHPDTFAQSCPLSFHAFQAGSQQLTTKNNGRKCNKEQFKTFQNEISKFNKTKSFRKKHIFNLTDDITTSSVANNPEVSTNTSQIFMLITNLSIG